MGLGRMAGGRTATGTAGRPSGKVFFFLLASLYGLGWNHAALSADDYLSEIDAEAKKLDASATTEARGGSGAETQVDAASVEPAVNGEVSRAEFERQLKEHYLGTFGFYKKLPERSREEVFDEYRRGADMGQLRKKIIDRLLQH